MHSKKENYGIHLDAKEKIKYYEDIGLKPKVQTYKDKS